MAATTFRKATVVGLAIALLHGCAGQTAPEIDRLQASREVTTRFAKELQQTLSLAIQEQGIAGAVGVCSEQAQAISRRFGEQRGARIGRTSARLRNTDNAPDAWQIDVLALFATEYPHPVSSGQGKLVEYFAQDAGQARYMRAIPTAPLCTACHGAQVSQEVTAAIASRYPKDAATGYQVGELRGAFYVVWDAE